MILNDLSAPRILRAAGEQVEKTSEVKGRRAAVAARLVSGKAWQGASTHRIEQGTGSSWNQALSQVLEAEETTLILREVGLDVRSVSDVGDNSTAKNEEAKRLALGMGRRDLEP